MDALVNWIYPERSLSIDDTESDTDTVSATATSYTRRSANKSIVSESKKRQKIAWFIVALVIGLIFGAGVLLGYLTRSFKTIDCENEPPLAKLHQVRQWNGSYASGTFVFYKCSDLPSAPLTEVYYCQKARKKWKLIFSIPCNCHNSPLPALGLSVYENSTVYRHIGRTVTYKCNPSTCSPISSTHICSKSRHWEPLDQYKKPTISDCYCNEAIPVAENLAQQFVSVINRTEHTLGSILLVYCTNETDSHLKETYLCTDAGVWQKIRNSSCLCEDNPPPKLARHHYRNWRNKLDLRQIGTVITYHCSGNANSHVYRIVLCDKQLNWSILFEDTGQLICKDRYHIEKKLLNYEEAVKSCKIKGGELASVITLEQEIFLKRVLEKGGGDCKRLFLSGKEDVGERWWWLSKRKLELNKTHWAENYPRGNYECVIMDRSTLEWKNEDCRNIHCFICEEQGINQRTGGCFGFGKCMAVSYQMNFKYAQVACSNMAHSLVTDFPSSKSKMLKIRRSINAINPMMCPTFYIGLQLRHRIYRSDGEAVYPVSLWKNASELNSGCITIHKDDDYSYLHGTPCWEKSCSICLFQGPDRTGLKAVRVSV